MMKKAALIASVTAALLVDQTYAQASTDCLSLQGSTQCPSFQDAYINPTNLTSAWPWFADVTDVSSFDTQFAQYFTDPNRFHATKFATQLQCDEPAADNTTLQWERTILCGQFSQISYSAQCNVQNAANFIMVCQDTCLDYAASEQDAVANPQVCAPRSDLTTAQFTTRNNTLTKDYVTCTDWTTLVSTNNATCIEGVTNEGNCGYGPGVSTQLCTACDPSGNSTVPSCCFDSKTDLTQCASYGHPAAAAIVATSSAAPGYATSTSAAGGNSADSANRSGSGGTGLTGGQLAGIIVGCIVAALILGALIAFLLIAARRRKNRDPEASHGLVYGAGSGSSDKAWNQSETGTTRSIGGSPLGEKNNGAGSAGGHGNGHHGMGAGAAAGAGALAGAAAMGEKNHHNEQRPDSQVSSGTGGSDGRGTTVSQVRDQYTGQDIFPGEDVVAIYPYNASLNDEITLEPEQRVKIVRLYDDGWALGRTEDGKEGALPLVCVSSSKGDMPGRGGTNIGTSEDDGMTSGAEYTSSVDGAVTAEEGGFTSDARSNRSGRR